MNDASNYTDFEHRFRFAAWCAATAARSSPKCRFSVEDGGRLIEQTDLHKIALGWHLLPAPQEFDGLHRQWRKQLITLAPEILGKDLGRAFSHGVAAKLINCYLKSLFVVGQLDGVALENLAKRDAIHPPIDRTLLDKLKNENVGGIGSLWGSKAKRGWSKFTSDEYELVISHIGEVTNGRLWTIEYYWQGFR